MLARHLGIPPRRGTTSFLSAVFIDALGTGFFAPFSLLYFNVVVGLPLTAVGLAVSIATIFTIPLIPLTGILVDRFGARRLVIAAQILQGAGFLGYLVVHNIPLLVLMAFFTAAGQRIFWSSYFTLATDMAAFGERDRWFGLLGTALITGVGIGNFLAGVLISAAGQSGYFVIIIINTLSFFLAATLLYVGVPASQHSKASETAHGGYRVVLRDRPFIAMIIVNIAFALCISLIGLGLPVYAANGLHLPVWVAGVALALNTALIAILQTILVRLLEPMRRTRALIIVGFILCGWCLLYILALVLPRWLLIPYIIIVTCIQAFGEAIHAPTSNALAAEASPQELRGRYLAVYQFSWAIAGILAPGMFTLLFSVSPALPWGGTAIIILLASLAIFGIEPHLPPRAVRSREAQKDALKQAPAPNEDRTKA